MPKNTFGLVSTGLLFALSLSTSALASVREDFERVVPFDPGGTFRIENTNGTIDVETWNESSVKIEAEKKAKDEDALADLEISIEGSGDSVTVETIHHRKRDRGQVNYHILLPAEARVSVQTANGAVTVTGIRGRVEARSVNGGVTVEDIAGDIEAETVNGAIRASYSQVADGAQRFSTTNGSVRVYLPSDAGGAIDAETVNGAIDVDFPVTLTRMSRRHMKGTFGAGASSFEIETVNGSVKLLTR
jgi:DUF4097 and DUF4098 domain-containing protein YvlB